MEATTLVFEPVGALQQRLRDLLDTGMTVERMPDTIAEVEKILDEAMEHNPPLISKDGGDEFRNKFNE